MKLQKLLDDFNNNDLDVEGLFNDYETFFKMLERRELLNQIDPVNGSGSENWQNEFLLWLYENDKEKFNYWVQKILDDIEIDETGNVFLVLPTIQELSRLFCGRTRNGWGRDVVESILSGEQPFDGYWNTTDNVYRDVIEELSKQNLEVLYKYMIEDLKETQIEKGTELLELIADEQNSEHPIINQNNVERVVSDEETMNFLLDDYLDDLKSNLYSIHSYAYNNAHETEAYDEIWKELSEYFIGRGEWVNRPHNFKKNTQVQNFRIPILDFFGFITDYLSENKKYGNSGTLEYQGYFLNLLNEEIECLTIYPKDYPDPRLVDKYINEYFNDYI